jgi:hydroxyacylglutathione hydrolase
MGSHRIPMLTPQSARDALRRGELLLIDLRPHEEFASGHIPGSINLMFSRKSLPERLATAIPPGLSIVLLSANPDDAEAAAEVLRGLERHPVRGVLEGGIQAWRTAGLPLATMRQMDVPTLRERLSDPEDTLLLIDVREPFEWDLGYIDGSLLIPLERVWERSAELDRNREVALICEEGIRSSTAASILLHQGFPTAGNVPGGLGDWASANYPTVRPPRVPRG